MFPTAASARKVLVAAAVLSVTMLGMSGAASAAPTFSAAVVLSGASLTHRYTPSGMDTQSTEALSKPDDLTRLGQDLFVGFQNGVGPQGEPSSDGNLDSTVVEFTPSGAVLGQWDVKGKTDGLTADPATGLVIATVNEDLNSSLYTIDPNAAPGDHVTHYRYNEPLPHNGGTDAISVYHGRLFISASAPGTTGNPPPQPNYPAVYTVTLDSTTHVATVTPLFYDEDAATVANLSAHGATTALALTDPDSSSVVPSSAPRFGGDFMLTSQGDLQQIYVSAAGRGGQHLWVLNLSQAVDDTAFPTAGGKLYSSDSTNDNVDVITGPFSSNHPMAVATPCGANSAPNPCTAANYLATLNQSSGAITSVNVVGASYLPQGALLFVP